MTIQTCSGYRRKADDPTSFEFLMSDEEIHMANVNAARTIFRVIGPILASGNHPLYSKVLVGLIKRLDRMVTYSAIRTSNSYYRGDIVIRMGDLQYRVTSSGSIRLNEVAA
jgi:hypothetical protein